MKALIHNGVVIQIEEASFPVAKPLEWIDCTDTTEIGGVYNAETGVISPAPLPSWEVQRQEAYGSIGEQLDMQYHDSIDGTTTWKDHITQVKTSIPKP